jgi:hypothetical protein
MTKHLTFQLCLQCQGLNSTKHMLVSTASTHTHMQHPRCSLFVVCLLLLLALWPCRFVLMLLRQLDGLNDRASLEQHIFPRHLSHTLSGVPLWSYWLPHRPLILLLACERVRHLHMTNSTRAQQLSHLETPKASASKLQTRTCAILRLAERFCRFSLMMTVGS